MSVAQRGSAIMWCSDCQQDVPAVANIASEPLVCPRCRRPLETLESMATPKDDGISLESFDAPEPEDLSPPADWMEQDEPRQRWQKIGRTLRVNALQQPSHLAWSQQPTPPPSVQSEVQLRAVARRSAATSMEGKAKASRGIRLLLSSGVVGLVLGLGLLAWSTAFQVPRLWQSGMTLTIGAEGLLILSLTWMAMRLWRNGRRVNRQLDGVDQKLTEMQEFAGSLADNRLSSSQHYYHHFNQAASPHMLVANLQGQVDQLAARMAVE